MKNTDNVTVASMIAAAKAEVTKEQTREFTLQYKRKLTELAQAEKLVKNIRTEIEDLEIALAEKLG